jgi:hypothetical protein
MSVVGTRVVRRQVLLVAESTVAVLIDALGDAGRHGGTQRVDFVDRGPREGVPATTVRRRGGNSCGSRERRESRRRRDHGSDLLAVSGKTLHVLLLTSATARCGRGRTKVFEPA